MRLVFYSRTTCTPWPAPQLGKRGLAIDRAVGRIVLQTLLHVGDCATERA